MILSLKSHPEIARIIRAADRSYRKHNAILTVAKSMSLNGTYWDGGSRSSYCAVNMVDFRCSSAHQYAPPQFGGPTNTPRIDIPDGVAIVQLGTFRGKTATASLYINPDNMAKLLPHLPNSVQEECEHD